MKKDVVILGSGGCAKELLFILEDNNRVEEEWNILGFVGEGQGDVLGYPILGDDEWLLHCGKEVSAFCAIGNGTVRRRAVQKYCACTHVHFPSLISRHAVIGKNVRLGKGCVIGIGAILTADVELGDFVIVNTGSVVSHECRIRDYCCISPGCCLSGNVCLEEGVNVGTGSQIIQGITVGPHSIIGAGATVIRDIPAGATAVGCPARVIKIGGKR